MIPPDMPLTDLHDVIVKRHTSAELRFWRENLLNDSERIGTVWLVEGQASCYWASKARKGLSDAHAHTQQ